MTTLKFELLTAGAVAYQRAIDSRSPQELSAEDAQEFVAESLRIGRSAQEAWLACMEQMGKGTPAEQARQLTTTLLGAIEAIKGIVRLGADIAKQATERWPGSIEPKDARNAQVLLANLENLTEEGNGVLELLSRPRQPFDPAMLEASHESFRRGQGKTRDDYLRERGQAS